MDENKRTFSELDWLEEKRKLVFVGESGCGKSETAIHFALKLANNTNHPVHLFDMDQTKPLFRSRDRKHVLEEAGVICHGQSQMLDAPTMAGGIAGCLEDRNCYTVVDVGGNETGARLIGGLSGHFNKKDTVIGYIVNPYRPWSKSVQAIDRMMAEVISAARIENYKVIASPNLGLETNSFDFLEGCKALLQMVGQCVPVEFAVVKDSLYKEVRDKSPFPLIPIQLHMRYPWDGEDK